MYTGHSKGLLRKIRAVPCGTGVTEKVTKTNHFFFVGGITCGLPWFGVVNILGEMNGSVSTSTWVVVLRLESTFHGLLCTSLVEMNGFGPTSSGTMLSLPCAKARSDTIPIPSPSGIPQGCFHSLGIQSVTLGAMLSKQDIELMKNANSCCCWHPSHAQLLALSACRPAFFSHEYGRHVGGAPRSS